MAQDMHSTLRANLRNITVLRYRKENAGLMATSWSIVANALSVKY